MKTTHKHNFLGALVVGGMAISGLTTQGLAQETRFDELANLPFADGRPTQESTQTLRDELLFERATQIYLWALPVINMLGMQVGSEKTFGAGYDVLPIWKKRLDAKTLVTTPNSDVLYAMSYVDLGKDGPLVMDAPPGLQGIFDDYWQRPIPADGGKYFGDIGLAGPDGGKGGKFLLLPPGYKGTVPKGYFVYRSATNSVFVFLRGFYEDPKNLTPAVTHLERTKIYPLNGEANAKPMKFPDASGVPVNMLPISDASAFDQLKLLLDKEGANLADPGRLGDLATIGIVKGQPFTPDAHIRKILDQAAKTGYAMSRVQLFQNNVGGVSYLIWPDRQWTNPVANQTPAKPSAAVNEWPWLNSAGILATDSRINYFTGYYAISLGMASQIPGKGANYWMAFFDSEGKPFVGASNYGLHLPPNIPAAIFWSLTLYDASNASGLPNGQPFPSLGSRDKPAQNPDGSTDLYLGPHAPEGKTGNWLATVPGKGYFAILRLYGPTEAALNKSWKPGDFEKVK